MARYIPASSLAIVTLHKEQFRLMERHTAQQGVALQPADSVQGREMDIATLPTTRTGIELNDAKFLEDKR
ncbi:hypothetical protein Y032_0101g3354 [Ancylostoma ceylanicum]|nr:hypothetical protein Y032_0101g3354 [Ancylostoma ceylanicum]